MEQISNNTGQGSAVTCNNFVKAKDAFSCVRGVILECDAYDVLHVFYLPKIKNIVGHYKLWNEVMFGVLSWCTGSQGNNHCSFFV